MKVLANLLILTLPALAFAAGGHHDEGIPKAVWYQIVNVLILVGGITYFTKDAIVSFFSGRKTEFVSAAAKSALAREEAERQFVDIKNKLAAIDTTRAETLKKAEAHAADLKKQIADEANEVTRRIREEAALTARLEGERAQRELRQNLLKDSVQAAQIVLSKDIGAADHQKLQKEFIKDIDGVSR